MKRHWVPQTTSHQLGALHRKLLCTPSSIPVSLNDHTAKSASFLYGRNYLWAPVNFYRVRLQVPLMRAYFVGSAKDLSGFADIALLAACFDSFTACLHKNVIIYCNVILFAVCLHKNVTTCCITMLKDHRRERALRL
jgi:hypothetical protein